MTFMHHKAGPESDRAPDPLPDPAPAAALDRELDQAAACFRDLLAQYSRIRKAVAGGASGACLRECISQMRGIDARAAGCGEKILAAAEHAGISLKDYPGYAAWRDLADQVLAENRRIKAYLKAAMAVAKDELDRMRTGKQALGGYHSKGSARGQNAGARINCGA
ncbi:hypothetical protein HNR65_003021 [Desulfosalsimonas propionicica]|uniref:FlgN protein n=1 Tax=Desulfosalsimonas propionicica TaxID=332175 RepID=A0A7W0CBF0_9BACT|nr:hypothetical protein [Desulfosalsimonas propionicica]MBA2882667.1 hypothetical protein [Desulfosalsimonas propionicica]